MAQAAKSKIKTLDINQMPAVQYAIPTWLRDEQIKAATARIKGRIQPVQEPRTERVAIVGFGPSLKDTWKEIKTFPFIFTCSGAHQFLIRKGIIPTWHVEVDPRPHKVKLLGPPHPDVEYLIASTCAPEYFDHLKDANVKLWHVFDSTEEGLRALPPGEWAVTGGCDAGLRAMTLAAFLGFRDLHIFGMDGCARGKARHAGAHPNGPQNYSQVEHKGKKYMTTPGMLMAAKQTLHELEQMPAVHATFYGKGLTQSLAGDYKPKATTEPDTVYANIIGFLKPELISGELRELNAELHRKNLAYGVGGGRHASVVTALAKKFNTNSVLDYGCGKSYLQKALPFPIFEYDPAIPGKDESPRPADIVICGDVLEHVEPDKIDLVLGDLVRCVKKIGYFVIHLGAARKTYPDGRNTHLIQQDKVWWSQLMSKYFAVGKVFDCGKEIKMVVGPKTK